MLKHKSLITTALLLVSIMINGCSQSDGNSTSTTNQVLVIDGYTLPPDPGEAGKETLLGVDSNDNGVRDDVERWIYTTYDKPIERAVQMQSAKAYQIVINEPEKALENLPVMQAATACKAYWSFLAKDENKTSFLEEYKDYAREIKSIQFNTADRFLAYEKYNSTLSGGVYSGYKMDEWSKKCEFDLATY
jgi:hypothetical protein